MRKVTSPAESGLISEVSADPIVEVTGIARKFGGRWALRGVSFSVAAGEGVALLGRNGGGKTTLLRILGTVLRPTRGSGRILGHDLVRERASFRGEIGILGHSPALYGDLTAEENLRFTMRMLGRPADRDQIREALSAVALDRFAGERTRGFSAGMQRRVGLARLLIQRPRLLLLDEPYASFDAAGLELIDRFLTDHLEGGGAAIVATHDPVRASVVLGRVIELEGGRVVDPGATTGEAALPPSPGQSGSGHERARERAG